MKISDLRTIANLSNKGRIGYDSHNDVVDFTADWTLLGREIMLIVGPKTRIVDHRSHRDHLIVCPCDDTSAMSRNRFAAFCHGLERHDTRIVISCDGELEVQGHCETAFQLLRQGNKAISIYFNIEVTVLHILATVPRPR